MSNDVNTSNRAENDESDSETEVFFNHYRSNRQADTQKQTQQDTIAMSSGHDISANSETDQRVAAVSLMQLREIPQQQKEVPFSQTNTQNTADATLRQMHNKNQTSLPGTSSYNSFTPANDEESRFLTSGFTGSGDNRSYHTRFWDNTGVDSRNATGQVENHNMPQNSMVYSQLNDMQNTIIGLTHVISNMQQEHASMHTRLDSITGTLGQVLSALTEIRDGHVSLSGQNSQSNTGRGENGPPSSSSNIDRHPGSSNGSSSANAVLCTVNETQPTYSYHSNRDSHSGAFAYDGPANSVSGYSNEIQTSSRQLNDVNRHYGSRVNEPSVNPNQSQTFEPQTNTSHYNSHDVYAGSNYSSVGHHSGPLAENYLINRSSRAQSESQATDIHQSHVDRHSDPYSNFQYNHQDAGSQNDLPDRVSSIDRHSGTRNLHAAQAYENGKGFSVYNETQRSEIERDFVASRYDSFNEDSGYSRTQPSKRQKFTGHQNEVDPPRVTFDETPRYDRYTSEDETFNFQGRRGTEVARTGRYQDHNKYTGQRRQPWPECYGLKIPPFNGKEDWRVWINRFETIAERRNWSEEAKIDNLLPKLQGKAGDFVFTQLSRDTLGCYRELVKELNSRFRIVETEKSFAAKFSRRSQKADETVEEYAAELKRLYAKAYKNRDYRTKQEDLVRRFLNGMRDNEARFEIEYHKEPDDIDQAVYHAVNFIQTRRRGSNGHSEKGYKRYARRTSQEYDSSSETEEVGETEDDHRALRVPFKYDKPQSNKTNTTSQQREQVSSGATEPNSMKVLTELVQTLVSQLNNQPSTSEGKKTQPQGNGGFVGRRKIQCYGCEEFGHIKRDCPKSDKSGNNTGSGRGMSTSQKQAKQQEN